MAYSSRAADILSSPSFNDTEAASQQLLAEASSPVRRPPAASVSANAVIGATLLNHARTLTKPPAMAPSASTRKAGKLPKLGQLKPVHLGPGRSEKPGKLSRASLSSLVSEGPPRRVRGDRIYEIDPSPQKRRPHSLPLQVAALEDEDQGGQLENALEDEHVVPDTSQVQPEDDAPVENPESEDPTAVNEGLTRARNIENVTVSSGKAPHVESTAALEKRPRRPRKSGESTTSAPSSGVGTVKAQDVVAVDDPEEDVHNDDLPSSPPVLPPREEVSATSRKPRGRPRHSGESAMPARLSDVEQFAKQERTEPPIVSTKLKRKTRVGEKQNSGTNGDSTHKSAKKQRRLNGPAMVSPEMAQSDEDLDALRTTAPLDARPHGDLQPEVRMPIRSTRSRTAKAEAELANAQEHTATAIPAAAIDRKAKPVTRPARSTRLARSVPAPEASKRKSSASARGSEREAAQADKHVGENIEEALETDFEPVVNHEQIADNQSGATSSAGVESDGRDIERVEDGAQQGDGQIDQEDDGGNEYAGKHVDRDIDATAERAHSVGAGQTAKDAVVRQPILDKVSNFTHSEGRSGVCSTKLGRTIHRMCDRSRVILSRPGEDCSLEDLTRCKDDLVTLLRSIGVKVYGERRVAFKRDAFAYLFRALTLVLEAMHDKLQEKEGDITESLGAMQIVHPYICELLRFKDTIDSWKVVVQQLTKGDRLIKGVESDLIAPLRTIEKEFRVHLRRLQKAEQSRQALAAVQRQREEEEQEIVEKEEALRSVRERRKRWQDLHIVRMQCEPDPSRRRRLRFIEPVQAEETDANGQPFKRVPFFGERSAPPPRWTAASNGREWTKEQETVLLDALQSSAALDHIFKTYCGPSGALRDFSVSDFAAKLVWVRSGWAQLSHQHGWDVPEWVKKIPILP